MAGDVSGQAAAAVPGQQLTQNATAELLQLIVMGRLTLDQVSTFGLACMSLYRKALYRNTLVVQTFLSSMTKFLMGLPRRV